MLLAKAVGVLLGVSAGVVWLRRRRLRPPLAKKISLKSLDTAQIPTRLLTSFYLDLDALETRGSPHVDFLRRTKTVVDVLDALHDYIVATLEMHARTNLDRRYDTDRDGGLRYVSGTNQHAGSERHPVILAPDATVSGVFDTSAGAISIGSGTVVEPGTLIRGPAIIGPNCVIRHGAYIRGDVVLGQGCVVGGELKHAFCLDECELPHHGYVGDSLLGHKAHFGCGALTANFPLFPGSLPAVNLPLDPNDADALTKITLGRRKFGAVIGDGSQLGCGSVTEPGALLGPGTHAYPLSRVPRGCYGPNELLKNRPVVERAPLRA